MSQNPLASTEPWDNIAAGYDDASVEIMLPFAMRALEIAALARDARIVDVAAGPGTLTLPAAEVTAEVCAIDFSPLMIDRLRANAQAAGRTNIDAEVGDGQALPYRDDAFDAGFSMFGLMFFPDRARGFAELFRVLRPGGLAVVSSWASVADSALMTLMAGAYQAGIPGYTAPSPNLVNLANPEVFESELLAAGFDEVSVQPHTVAYTHENGEQLWDRMARGSAPVHVMRSRFDEATWKAQEQTMIEYLIAHYVPGTPLSTTAYLGTGRKPR
ncbi:methyltransferase domain-containing protein [Nocardia sp. NPDC051030]|uniref:class I SAM-dependent methyltransferase n=1 Tax=Nocardia sp. NPDC051030 TaxID=3155162 RepID=UPI0034471410